MTTTTNDLVAALAAKITASQRAKRTRIMDHTDNGFEGVDLERMATAGLDSQDIHPAVNHAPKGGMGYDLEEARIISQAEARRAADQRRKAEARARQARRDQIEALDEDPRTLDALPTDRVRDAWLVVATMLPILQRMVQPKVAWIDRYLGQPADDVTSTLCDDLVLWLARSTFDLDVMHTAAEQLATVQRETGMLPGDQDKAAKREVKALRKARKLLMSAANNRLRQVLSKARYETTRAPESYESLLESTIAHVMQPGEDPLVAHHLAARAPSFQGWRPHSPDGIDPAVIAMSLAGAITDRGLDPLVELILAELEEHGRVRWNEVAEQVFLTTPDGLGEWLWQQVLAATSAVVDGQVQPMDRAASARGAAARAHARNLLDYLNDVVLDTVNYVDYWFFAVSSTAPERAILARPFDVYCDEPVEGLRQIMQPALQYGSADDAAAALLDVMAGTLA